MTLSDWQAHLDSLDTGETDRVRRQAELLTLELAQPLVQSFRRRRPRRRASSLPLFDPRQTFMLDST